MLSIARQELANPGMEAKPRTASLVMATGGLAYRRQCCCKLKLAAQYSYVHPFLGHLNVVAITAACTLLHNRALLARNAAPANTSSTRSAAHPLPAVSRLVANGFR